MRETIQRAWDELVYRVTGNRPWLTRKAEEGSKIWKQEMAKPGAKEAVQEYFQGERQPTGGFAVRKHEVDRDDGRDR
jgi:hypothetical protein